jgi:hypothetical protein
MPKLELMQVHLHAVTLPPLRQSLHLGLRGHLGMSDYSRWSFRRLSSYLVLHEQSDYSGYSRKNYATFYPHLVLHDIPGHSRHRRRRVGRRWCRCWLLLGRAERVLPTTTSIVVAIRFTPRSVRSLVLCLLTARRAASPLPITDPNVRLKPSPANATRTLLSHSAHDHRSTTQPSPTLTLHAGGTVLATPRSRSRQWVISDE